MSLAPFFSEIYDACLQKMVIFGRLDEKEALLEGLVEC